MRNKLIRTVAVLAAMAGLAGLSARAAAPAAPQGVVTAKTYPGDVRQAIINGQAPSPDGTHYPGIAELPFDGFPGAYSGDPATPPPGDVRNNYTMHLQFYFYAPKAGKLQFAIASDDPGNLFVSTDANPANKKQVATEPQWNPVRDFAGGDPTAPTRRTVTTDGADPSPRPENWSPFFTVTANQILYVEAVANEGGGGDNLAVAFRYSDDPDFTDDSIPVEGKYTSSADREDLKATYVSSFTAAPDGFTVAVHDGDGAGAASLDPASVKAKLDGADVTATATKSGAVVTVAVKVSTILASGSKHTAVVTGKDSTGKDITITQEFTAPVFTLVPKGLKVTADTSKPGFLMRVFQNEADQANNNNKTEAALSGKLSNADGLLPNLADPAAQGVASGAGRKIGTADNGLIEFDIPTVINMSQNGADNAGNWTTDDTMPGIPGTGGSTDGIAAEFIAYIELPAGATVMGVNSDDGFRTGAGEGGDVFNPPLVLGEFSGGRGAADTIFTLVAEEAGVYCFRTIWQEGGGGANIEWFTVKADGTKVLVNDTANGGLKAYRARTVAGQKAKGTLASPGPGAGGVAYDATINLALEDGENAVDPASVVLKLDGADVNATKSKTGKVTTISYKPAAPFAPKSTHTINLSYKDGADTITREWSFITLNTDLISYWDFNDASDPAKTKDSVSGATGTFERGAKFSNDSQGRTGRAGDRGAVIGADDTGSGAIDGNINVSPVAFLNQALVQNKLAVSLWQKWENTSKNQSILWMNGEGQDRMFQAHTPWGDNTIYFDTGGGCCDGSQRIAKNISEIGADPDTYWKQWHHIVLQKDGDQKQVWIDGVLFNEGVNTSPMSKVATVFRLGSDSGGGNSFHGILDDVAIFASGLTPAEVDRLFKGEAPTAIRGSAPPPSNLKFTSAVRDGNNVVLTWTGGGTLQGATDIKGPWTDIAGATSPRSVAIGTDAVRFWRLRQ